MINDPSRHGLIIGDLSDSIPKGLNSPPVKDLINRGANVNEITQLLAVLILKYSRLLHIGGTMTANDEPKMIAKMLISEYPLNSLDDFNIILQRGIMGKYGKIMGFDISVIFFWAQQYQDEWAEEKEKQLAKERNKLSEMIEPKEGEWSEETTKLVKEFQEKLREGTVKSVPKLTEKEIKEQGKERIKPRSVSAGHSTTNQEYIIEKELKRRYYLECYDKYTGKPNENWMSFEDWKLI